MSELSREDFRQWLVAKEPDEVVGKSGDSDRCPGTTWLRALGYSKASVHHNAVCISPAEDGRGENDRAPWLQQFAGALDEFRAHDPYQPVTAKYALAVLDSLDVS